MFDFTDIDPDDRAEILKLGIVGLVTVIIFVMWVAVGVSIYYSRQAALGDMTADAGNLALAFDDELTHSLDAIDQTMDAVANRMRTKGSDMNIYAWAREIPIVTGPIVAAGIVAPNGIFIGGTQAPHMKPMDMSFREHIRDQLDGKSKGIFVGKPIKSLINDQMAIPVSKRVETEDGRFVGVLVFLVLPAKLTTLSKSINLGNTGIISLVGMDKIIRARFSKNSPEGLDGIGQSVARVHGPVIDPENSQGSFIEQGTVDNLTRLYSYRRVAHYPLFVSVGLGYDEGLASWRTNAKSILVLSIVATFLVGGFALYLVREIGLRTRRDLELADERRRLQALNIELSDERRSLQATNIELAGEHRKLRAANAELTESRKRAEAANQAKTCFLANMSHELRTPLNAILGFSQIIKDQIMGPVGKPAYADYAKDIHGSGEHLLKLINNLLDMAKIEAGKTELHEEVLDPAEIVRASMMEVSVQAANKGIALETDIPAGTPFIRGDALRLREVLINLLSNAVKFTEIGAVRAAAAFDAARGFSFSVADTGVGMSPHEIKKALEPFGQVDNAYSKTCQGTGFGLPLAQRFVELHGGHLDIASVKGGGTTVSAYLPPERAVRPVSEAAA